MRFSPSTKHNIVGMHRMPYHRPRLGLRSSLTRATFKESTDSLAISSRIPSNVIDGRLHPVANPTSTGWLDFRTSVSKFVSVTSTVDFIRQDKGSAHTPATAGAEGCETVSVVPASRVGGGRTGIGN